MKKDILFLCQYFYPEYISSATLPFDTAKSLATAGYKVGALCGYPKEYALIKEQVSTKETVDSIEIHRLKYLQLSRAKLLGRLLNYFSFSLAVLFHICEMRKYRYVIVYSNPPVLPALCVLAKKLFRTKFIFVAYDIYPEIAIKTGAITASSFISRFMKKLNSSIYKNVEKVVALSTEMKEFILEHREIRQDRIEVIPNWYENETEQKLSDDSFSEKLVGKMVISYFGNMGICQDIDTIMQTMVLLKNNPEVYFLFAGHGSKKEELRAFVNKENIKNAEVLDFLHGEDYLSALRSSSCAIVSLAPGITGLCVPSKSYAYLMSRLPVIAILDDSELVRDLVTYEAGFTIKNGEAEKLAEQILALKNNEELRKRMRENARCLFLNKYTTEICTNQYVALFDGLLGTVDDTVL